MSHNRIPRRVFSERDRVLARVRQDAAFATYELNVDVAETAAVLYAGYPSLAQMYHADACATAAVHAGEDAERRYMRQAALYMATTDHEVQTVLIDSLVESLDDLVASGSLPERRVCQNTLAYL